MFCDGLVPVVHCDRDHLSFITDVAVRNPLACFSGMIDLREVKAGAEHGIYTLMQPSRTGLLGSS